MRRRVGAHPPGGLRVRASAGVVPESSVCSGISEADRLTYIWMLDNHMKVMASLVDPEHHVRGT